MTLIEVRNNVLSFFSEHDVLNLETDIESINLSEDLKQNKQDVLNTCLLDLEALGYIRNIKNTKIWILVKSFEEYEQNVVINASLAIAISDTINMFREANEILGDSCDKTNITSKDIANLVNICHILAEEEQVKNPEDVEEGDEDE